jgi:ribosome-binding factor A
MLPLEGGGEVADGGVDADVPALADAGSDVDAGADAAPVTPPPPPPPPADPTAVAITDVDLSPDGSFALAVARDRSAVIRLPIPAAFTDSSHAGVTRVPNELVGSVEMSPDGRYAVLYTTAVDQVERITILDLQDEAAKPRHVQLRKSVRAIAISPDSAIAVMIHKKLDGDPNDPFADTDTTIDRSFGYSLVNLATGFVKLEVTPTEIGPFTTVTGHLFVLLSDATNRLVRDVRVDSFQSQSIRLGSPPLSIGAVPGSNKIFVGQDHAEGRITFIDWTNGSVRSVTGFELNSRIRE